MGSLDWGFLSVTAACAVTHRHRTAVESQLVSPPSASPPRSNSGMLGGGAKPITFDRTLSWLQHTGPSLGVNFPPLCTEVLGTLPGLGFLRPGYGEHELLSVLQMPMAELLVSHGASLSARTSMDEMPIGKTAEYFVCTYLPCFVMVSRCMVGHMAAY